jgi:hypothetical protein
MEGLVRAIADFFAVLLSMVGFVGKARRRAHIRDDLQLITGLADHADFGRGSWPHQALMNRVALDVGRLAGVPMPGRKIPWRSAILALLIGVPCGYATYTMNGSGFNWWSLVPGTLAAVMAISFIGMLMGPQEEELDTSDHQFQIRPPAGDINAPRPTPDS